MRHNNHFPSSNMASIELLLYTNRIPGMDILDKAIALLYKNLRKYLSKNSKIIYEIIFTFSYIADFTAVNYSKEDR